MRPDPSQGVFETMLVRDGRVHAQQRHIDRLARSIGALYGLRLPAAIDDHLRAEARGLGREHRLRVDVVPGQDIVVSTGPAASGYRRPVALEPLVVPGGLGPHKWRDRRLLDARPADPAPLLVDSDGTVLEAAWGNIWMLEDDRLVTPPADGRILPGVTRTVLLELAPSLALRPREEPISLHRLESAPVTFATSAIRLAVTARLTGHAAAPTDRVDRIRAALAAHC